MFLRRVMETLSFEGGILEMTHGDRPGSGSAFPLMIPRAMKSAASWRVMF
jgi:hypothetical protein